METHLSGFDSEKVEKILDIGSYDSFLESDVELNDQNLEIFEKCYDASISYLDSIIEKIYASAPDNTAFIILGDHGELFGEAEVQGRITGHHFGTFNELVHVPLIAFPTSSNVSGLLDHRCLRDLSLSIMRNEDFDGLEVTFSEYYGKQGFLDSFDEESDLNSGISQRQSFSVISRDYKLDITSEGEKLEGVGKKVEEESKEDIKNKLMLEMPFVLRTILEDRSLL
jgi:membrane-anchored protein YejM (alkaline phosphatase superfamily)